MADMDRRFDAEKDPTGEQSVKNCCLNEPGFEGSRESLKRSVQIKNSPNAKRANTDVGRS